MIPESDYYAFLKFSDKSTAASENKEALPENKSLITTVAYYDTTKVSSIPGK